MALNSTPITWTAGSVVTAAQLNTEVRDALTGIQAAWTAYTPTTTGITLGTATPFGRYTRIGKTVHFECGFVFSATSAITAAPTFTLPVNAFTLSANFGSGEGDIFDTSAGATFPAKWIATATGVATVKTWPAAAGAALANVSASLPMVWATGDVLTLHGTYEAA